MKITHLLAGNGHDDRTSPLVVAEGNASKPPAPPPESSSSEVPSYTAKGEPAVIGGKALPGSASHAAEVSASAPPPSEASSQNVSHAFVSYDSAGQSILVGPGHIHAPSGGGLPDGVYVGFNIPGVDKNTVPHEYVEVIINSQKTIFEYGPSGTWLKGEGSPIAEDYSKYHDSNRNAGALFSLTPPSGESLAQFEERTRALGKAMDAAIANGSIKYDVAGQGGPNCYTAADAILLNDGVSIPAIFAIGQQASLSVPGLDSSVKGPLNAAFTAFAGLSPFVTPSNAADLVVKDAINAGILNNDWLGNDYVTQMQRNAAGQWEVPQPYSIPSPTGPLTPSPPPEPPTPSPIPEPTAGPCCDPRQLRFEAAMGSGPF